MSPNRRIFLNIVATYGRSLYTLVIGLFCGRWTLMALGEVDYGLMGVVGGLTAFVTFLNGIMAGGIGRFYAISVGAVQKDSVNGLDECYKWFTTAVVVHTILPTILMIIGYPIGEWTVRHFLTIPPDRIQSCVWVWRCICVSTFIGMVGIPFSAWYGAKQEIAELTIYGFITATLNVCFMYYAIHHPGDWLVPLAVWNMIISLFPQLIICARAGVLYKECRIRRKYLMCVGNIKKMMSFSGWIFIGACSGLLRGQGLNILVNKAFGPVVNAAHAIGNTLAGQCTTLSGSMVGAFSPAIMNAYGSGDYTVARKMALRVSKIATMSILIFAIPLCVEINTVLRLWLRNPPSYSAGLCQIFIIEILLDKISTGQVILVSARGKMALYQSVVGGIALMSLPVAIVFLILGANIYWVVAASSIVMLFQSVARVFFAQKLVGLSANLWLKSVLIPLLIVSFIAASVAILPSQFMTANFVRIVVTTLVSEVVLLPLSWNFVLDKDEKTFIQGRLKSLLKLKV